MSNALSMSFDLEVPTPGELIVFCAEDLAEVVAPPKPQASLTLHQLAIALNCIANTGTIWTACIEAGMSRKALWEWRKREEAVEELFVEAKELYKERLHATIHQRAVEGWDEPIHYKGQVVGKMRKFSEKMLEMQLKVHSPAYKDRQQVDHNVSGGILVLSGNPGSTTKEDWMEEAGNIKRIVSDD